MLQIYLNKKKQQQKRAKEYSLCQPFIEKCVKLCWLMVIQDPPLALDQSTKQKDTFQEARFRHFTKSGTKIDFVVWPPLLLHDGGPLLQKGIAQPKWQLTSDYIESAISSMRKNASFRICVYWVQLWRTIYLKCTQSWRYHVRLCTVNQHSCECRKWEPLDSEKVM